MFQILAYRRQNEEEHQQQDNTNGGVEEDMMPPLPPPPPGLGGPSHDTRVSFEILWFNNSYLSRIQNVVFNVIFHSLPFSNFPAHLPPVQFVS